MSHLTIAYARRPTLGGFLIRNADRWGRWSHSAIADPTRGVVIEALAGKGVVETPALEFELRYSRGSAVMVGLEVPDANAGLAWARAQVGKGYDYGAIFGNVFRESWQEDDRWTCSELVEMALYRAGRERFRDAPWRISPNISYMVR